MHKTFTLRKILHHSCFDRLILSHFFQLYFNFICGGYPLHPSNLLVTSELFAHKTYMMKQTLLVM